MTPRKCRLYFVVELILEVLTPQSQGFRVMAANVFNVFHYKCSLRPLADMIQQLRYRWQVATGEDVLVDKAMPW